MLGKFHLESVIDSPHFSSHATTYSNCIYELEFCCLSLELIEEGGWPWFSGSDSNGITARQLRNMMAVVKVSTCSSSEVTGCFHSSFPVFKTPWARCIFESTSSLSLSFKLVTNWENKMCFLFPSLEILIKCLCHQPHKALWPRLML